jgi:hypothetical protein
MKPAVQQFVLKMNVCSRDDQFVLVCIHSFLLIAFFHVMSKGLPDMKNKMSTNTNKYYPFFWLGLNSSNTEAQCLKIGWLAETSKNKLQAFFSDIFRQATLDLADVVAKNEGSSEKKGQGSQGFIFPPCAAAAATHDKLWFSSLAEEPLKNMHMITEMLKSKLLCCAEHRK